MAWKKDRDEEEALYRSARPPRLGIDVIRKLQVAFDKDGDLVFAFENGERMYGLIVVLADASKLGWKECQCIADAMKIASRGTEINNDTFRDLLGQLENKYGKIQGPTVQQRRLLGVVYPGAGTVRGQNSHTILHTGISFDKDGDFVFLSQTSEGFVYRVCLELTVGSNAFTNFDCQAFGEVLGALETGDRLDPDGFFALGMVLRAKYNFVRPTKSSDGKFLTVSVLPSRVENKDDIHPLFLDAVQRVMASRESVSHEQNSSNECPSCPYPNIRYTKALKEGGQAQVYAAMRDSDKVAVKVFLEGEDQTASYKTELRMLLKMSQHRNVVEVLDFFETPSPALVTRLIDGEDLMDYIQKSGRLGEPEGRKLAIGIAEGLCHLHRHGIIHRDLKSPNILRQKDGTPIIIDLGLSSTLKKKTSVNTQLTIAQLCQSLATTHLTDKTVSIKGSIPWMAPEMITEQQWSERTDVYAFGIIMWEIFSGKKPFIPEDGRNVSPMNLILAISAGARPPTSEVSHLNNSLRELIESCWHQDPKKRPTMRRALDQLRGNDPREIFRAIDSDKSGALNFVEFVAFLGRYAPRKVPPDVMFPLFQMIDENSSGDIGVDEFEKFWRQVEVYGIRTLLTKCKGKVMKQDHVDSLEFSSLTIKHGR